MTNKLLRLFGKTRRPFGWIIMITGLVGVFATFPLGITVGIDDTNFWITLAGFFLLFLDGYDKVADVEDEIDSEASPNEVLSNHE